MSSKPSKSSKKKEPEDNKKGLKRFAEDNIEFKLSVLFATIALIANALLFFLAILPIYDLVGDSLDGNISETLDMSETATSILSPVIYASVTIAALLLIIGTYKHVRRKSKSQYKTKS